MITLSTRLSHTLGFLGGLCLSGLLPFITPRPAVAAERVTLTYGFVEISTTVESLRTYGQTGEVNRELAPYINFLSPEQRSQFRQALQARQEISPVQMSRFLYSAVGDNILRFAGDIIQTQGRRDGAKGLRGALVLAAAESEGLSILGVLEHFPTNNVRIDGQQGFRAFNSVTRLIADTNRAIAAIENQKSPPSLVRETIPAFPELSQPGPYGVETQTISLFDSERNRTLPTDLYLPASLPAGMSAPVVVFSHGLAGDRKGFIPISQHLASHGYAIAAIDHPGSNRTQLNALLSGTAQELAAPTEFSDRPRDISYLLDELTQLNQANGPLANRLNLDKVGIMGHSFGGYTALAIAGAQLDFDNLKANCDSDALIYNAGNPSMVLQCTALLAPEQFAIPLRDERVDIVMALNPISSSLFGPRGFSQMAIPSLFVSGSEDPLAPTLLEQIRPFTWLNQPQMEANDHYLALIKGGSHLYESFDLEGADDTLSSPLVSIDIPLTDRYLKAMSLGFLRAKLDQDPVYLNVLNDISIVQLGEQPLPLYIVNTLTEAMLRPVPAAPTTLTPVTPEPVAPETTESGTPIETTP